MIVYTIGPEDEFVICAQRIQLLESVKHLVFPLDESEISWDSQEPMVFLIDLDTSKEKYLNHLFEKAKENPLIKIVYFTNHLKAQSKHQSSKIGGDAYFSWNVEEEVFETVLKNLYVSQLDSTGLVRIADIDLAKFGQNPKHEELNNIFKKYKAESRKPAYQSANTLVNSPIPDELALGEEDMSDKDQELSLDDLDSLEIGDATQEEVSPKEDTGLDLDLSSDADFDFSSEPDDVSDTDEEEGFDFGEDIDLGEENFDLSADADEDSDPEVLENLGDLDLDMNFSTEDEISPPPPVLDKEDLTLSGMDAFEDLSLGDEADMSAEAKEKLKEIDAIMDLDASQVSIHLDDSLGDDNFEGNSLEVEDSIEEVPLELSEADTKEDVLSFDTLDTDLDLGLDTADDNVEVNDIETPLVGDDVDLTSIDFPDMEEEVTPIAAAPEKSKKKKETEKVSRNNHSDINEISGAYSGEMERLLATISNLRADRDELLAKISKFEEEKIIQNRENLTLRAELDEKKIELTIIRRKLNEEISELKDTLKVHEEKKLILDEKNRILASEIEKVSQRNKLDVKKVQIRERELEQKLELLKADTETQIKHRDLKILELKRKIDSMEFDMESISDKEQKSVESRFELEDKLDKAIKTLRNAITLLEDDPENRASVVNNLKKNIDV